MVAGAMRLLASAGVQRTSIQNVTEATKTPRGSIYHFFPRGKEQLIEEALDRSCGTLLNRLEDAQLSDVDQVVRGFVDVWRMVLDATDYSAGCAVVGVAVSGENDHQIDMARAIFDKWQDRLAELLGVAGMAPETARDFAELMIAASEGAVILARARHSREPLDTVERQLLALARTYDSVGELI